MAESGCPVGGRVAGTAVIRIAEATVNWSVVSVLLMAADAGSNRLKDHIIYMAVPATVGAVRRPFGVGPIDYKGRIVVEAGWVPRVR